MKTWKNIGAAEGWVRLTGGALLILLGLMADGWIRWLALAAGLALVLTGAIGY